MVDLWFYRGDDIHYDIRFYDHEREPLEVEGADITMTVRDDFNGTVRLQHTVIGEGYSAHVYFPSEETHNIRPGGFVYDIEVRYNGKIITIITGNLFIAPDATRKMENHTLVVDKQGGGSVTLNGEDIELPHEEENEHRSMVALGATPEEGYAIDKWIIEYPDETVEVPDEESIEFDILGDMVVTIVFSEVFTLMIHYDGSGEGTVYADGVPVEDGWSAQYFDGEVVELMSIPDEGCRYGGWDDGFEDNPRMLLMDDDKELTVIFALLS